MISYLQGNETITAARMNALVGGFETKMNKLLGSRSPIIAFAGPIPHELLGKCFFFGSSTLPAKFAARCRQAKIKSGSYSLDDNHNAVLHTYDHAKFTAALAAASGHVYDEANQVVTIDRLNGALYPLGFAPQNGVSLFDHSLEAHKITRPSDGKIFYVKESGIPHAEKHFRYALAEIIVDGLALAKGQALAIPDTYDKFECFRIHNLDADGALEVNFGSAPFGPIPPGDHSALTSIAVEVPPLGCVVVRRTRTGANPAGGSSFNNYRIKQGYFFDYKGGDYRHFWMHPLTFDPDFLASPTAGNSMTANNLSCPTVVYDWIAALRETPHARFLMDPHEVCDIYSRYRDEFGDPANENTLLGDLIWHKGKVLLCKIHKTNKQPAPNDTLADVEFKELEFRGLSTLVTDWAAEGIEITEDAGSGNSYTFRISAAAAANYSEFLLVPYETNLFKDAAGRVRAAYSLTTTAGPTLAREFFEQQLSEQHYPLLSITAPRGFENYNFTESPNRLSWWDYAIPTAPVEKIVTGDPFLGATNAAQNTAATTLEGLHRHRVSQVTALTPFLAVAPQAGGLPYRELVQGRMVLTPHGLKVLCTERMPSSILGRPHASGVGANAWNHDNQVFEAEFLQDLGFSLEGAFLIRKHVIHLRGHGFGWMEKAVIPPPGQPSARVNAMWSSPRHGRRVYRVYPYSGDLFGVAGADYTVSPPNSEESATRVLGQTLFGHLTLKTAGSRFWYPLPQDALDLVWRQRAKGDTSFKAWLINNKSALIAGLLPGTSADQQFTTYQLLADHYNGLAMAVNQCKSGIALNYKALRFIVRTGISTWLAIGLTRNPQYTGEIGASNVSNPIPVDAWDFNATWAPGNANTFLLYRQNGIPIRGINNTEFPGWDAALQQDAFDYLIRLTASYIISGAVEVRDPFTGAIHYDANIRCNSIEESLVRSVVAGARGSAMTFSPTTAGYLTRINLGQSYAGFEWVKQSDVLNWITSFGLAVLPAGYDEIFIPLELKNLKAATTLAKGSEHKLGGSRAVQFIGGNPDGTYQFEETIQTSAAGGVNALTGEGMAFVPARSTAQAKWKIQAFTRTIKDVRWWDALRPMYNVGQVQPPPFRNAAGFLISFRNLEQRAAMFSADGQPRYHIEFAPSGTEEEDHQLWMQMFVVAFLTLAIRVGSGDPTQTSRVSLGYVPRSYWGFDADAPYQETHQIISEANSGPSFPRGSPIQTVVWLSRVEDGMFPEGFNGNLNRCPWPVKWITPAGLAAPSLAAGINILKCNTDTGAERYHVHFQQTALGIIEL